jgi:gliding motility-associated-like protein
MKNLLALLVSALSAIAFGQETGHAHDRRYALTENKGQWPSQVLFRSRSQGQNVWVQQHGFLYDLRDYGNLRKAHANSGSSLADSTFQGAYFAAEFTGSREVSEIERQLPVSYTYSYFIGSDSARWASDVRSYQEVILKDFYNGIDLKISDKDNSMKYELWCQPGSDASAIAIRYKGFAGKLRTDKAGDLLIETALGTLMERKPVAYELRNGKLTEISCSFVIEGETVRFKTGKISPEATLIIDPVLVFATYSGSPSDNFGMTATYGYDGTAYSAGTVYGNSYPTPDPAGFDVTTVFSTVYNGINTTDVFVSKYTADGTDMIWTGFLGGGNATQGTETAHSLICDAQNNIYVYGVTASNDFPTQNAYQSFHAGGTNFNVQNNGTFFGSNGTDIYVSKISANGHTLLGSTYVGGSLNDGVNYSLAGGSYGTAASYDSLTSNYGDQYRGEIMIDQNGDVIVASCTRSLDFPDVSSILGTRGAGQDGVIFKLSSDLSDLMWSRYFGGSRNDACYSVKVDSSFNILFAGGTGSPDLPATSGAWQSSYQGGKADGFVAKLTPDGQTLVRCSYLGQPLYDQAFFVEINRNDEVFLYGQTRGGTFPIVNATGNSGAGQFIAKLDPALTTLLNSTTFGSGDNNFDISPSAFLVDICGNMYVSGWGGNILDGSNPLNGMPISPNAFLTTPPNSFDFYLGVFDRDFDGLLYGSYLGGNQAAEHVDGGTSRFDKNGVVYQSVCGGCGGHSDFPTTPGAWSMTNQNTGNGNCNNVVFKFDFELIPEAQFTTDDLLGCEDYTVQLQNTSPSSDAFVWDFGNGELDSTTFNPVITYTEAGTYEIMLTVTDSICLLTDTARITVTVLPDIQLSASSDIVLCSPDEVTLTASATGGDIVWSSSADFSDTLNVPPASSIAVDPEATTTYYVRAANNGCSAIDSVTVSIIAGALDLSGDDSLCVGETTAITAALSAPGVDFDYAWSSGATIEATEQENVVNVTAIASAWVYCTATGTNGCIVSDSIFIHTASIDGIVSAAASPAIVTANQLATLTASPPGNSYTWVPEEPVQLPHSRITPASVDETTVFTVFVSDSGCVKSAQVKVTVMQTICGGRFVYVPNAFSPNGDGENDQLYVYSSVADEILFRVFDRWGEKIFESTSINDGWDGTFRGKLVDPDVYDYYLKAVCFDGEENIIKGNITLIR